MNIQPTDCYIDTDQPDTQEGDYFVSVVDGGQYGLLLGPFVNDHAGALANVEAARNVAQRINDRAVFYSFGTCRLPINSGRKGILQHYSEMELPAPRAIYVQWTETVHRLSAPRVSDSDDLGVTACGHPVPKVNGLTYYNKCNVPLCGRCAKKVTT